MVRVYLQQNCIPHYREPIFELLSACPTVEFTVFADSLPDSPFLKVISWNETKIRRRYARNWKISLPKGLTLSWQPTVLRAILHEKPNLIIAMGSPYSLTAWACLIVGRLTRIPVLLWGHGLLKTEKGLKWFIRRTLYRMAAGQLLYGNHAKRLLAACHFDPRSLHVIYNSLMFDQHAHLAREITPQTIVELRQSLGMENEPLVMFTGRLQPVKRLDILIMAIGEIARRGRSVHLAILGDGSERASLESLARSLGIERLVHFLGAQYDESFIGVALSAASLAVVPSGAGLSVIHALSFGTPVVIHDRVEEHFPEWEAVEEGVTGFFYRYGNPQDLSLKIEEAVFPIPRKPSMENACRTVIKERYNPHRQVDVILRAVNELVSKNGLLQPEN